MMYNVVNEVNGYVRGAWGWLDTDGDGVFDVLDTFPKTEVEALLDDGMTLRLSGLITDVPAQRWSGTSFSANRIRTLEYRFADVADSPWFAVDLAGRTRGREFVDAFIGDLPAGTHTIEVRAINSVGNVEPTPTTHVVTVDDGVGNAAPFLRLSTPQRVGSTTSVFELTAAALDLDGADVLVRFDLDGDGTYDTPFGAEQTATTAFGKAGIFTVGAQAEDADGRRTEATLELLVARDNTAPRATIVGATSPIHGSASLPIAFQVGDVSNVEGGALEYNWIAELATMTTEHRVETGFSAGNTTFETLFETPVGLVTNSIDLTGGNEDLRYRQVFDIERIGTDVLAMALGGHGLVFVDISDRKAPVVLARLQIGAVAYSLHVDGDRLYVLGGTMTVVDVSDASAPVEIEQMFATNKVRASRNRDEAVIDERWGAWHGHDVTWGEPIRNMTVRMVIDHPDHSELRVELFPPKSLDLKPIVLMDGDSTKSGRRSYRFTKHNTPALAELVGVFAMDNWDLRVTDTAANEVNGSLVRSRLKFKTRHRAIPCFPARPRSLASSTATTWSSAAKACRCSTCTGRTGRTKSRRSPAPAFSAPRSWTTPWSC